MKKSELLRIIDWDLLDRLFAFCYHRTPSSHAAQDLCSDIVFELVRAANSEGEIGADGTEDDNALYAFVWRVARNVYADYSDHRRRETDRTATGDTETLFALLSDEDDTEEREALERDSETLRRIYREIANLTSAYRTVMIAYYLDGAPIRDIARMVGTSENTVRQRLFSARETVRKEVTTMENTEKKPISLRRLDLSLLGNGDPTTGDPRPLIERQLSRHILWLCRRRDMSAREIAEELNVPMIYIEEELEIQTRGVGKTHYATLRRLENGRYIANIPLLSKSEISEGCAIYRAHHKALCDKIQAFIRNPEIAKKYFNFPYLNHKPSLDLIWWQHFPELAYTLGNMVSELLKEKYFADVTPTERPFHLFGHEMTDDSVGFCGWDGIAAKNICGYRRMRMDNLYIYSRGLQPHFHCGHDVANDEKIQLALRAIEGLPVADLTENEREQAARAIECGYLLREEDMLYTKILVMAAEDADRVWDVDRALREEIRPIAEEVAEKTAAWLRSVLPPHLMEDYLKVSSLASASVLDAVLDDMLERGLLEIPEGGLGAEGCWMTVEK